MISYIYSTYQSQEFFKLDKIFEMNRKRPKSTGYMPMSTSNTNIYIKKKSVLYIYELSFKQSEQYN